MSILFKAQNITKRYADHVALDDVSIQVPKQSIFGLLGPNGAGKTTLIRIINQIIAPDSGRMYFGKEKLRPKHVAQIGYLPEERGLYRKMAVGEQALYLARLKGLGKKEATGMLMEWFEKFGIEGWWNTKVEELSKGMQQKVQFIVTVLHQPRLLIFDEPFSGFDPINAQLIKEEILELQKKGSTIIFSTHRMESVEELCDHIALINNSKKILDGSIEEVRALYHGNMYEIEFTGNMIAFTQSLWAGAEIVETKQLTNRTRVKLRLLHQNKTNDLLHAVMPHVTVHSLREVVPTMNEIFIDKVQEMEPAPELEMTGEAKRNEDQEGGAS